VFNNIYKNILSFDNNQLAIRYLLSFGVFYSHMFAIYGLKEPALLWGVHSLGWYSVNGFFFISGILIAQSYNSKNIITYFLARVFRIMPAYVVSLFVAVFLAIVFSDASISIYAYDFINYIFSNLIPLNGINSAISGIWIATGQPSAMNNSIWTIPFEIFCYIFIVPLIMSSISKKYKLLLLFVSIYFLTKLGIFYSIGLKLDLLRVIFYFSLGIATYISAKNKTINLYFIGSLLVLISLDSNFKESILNICFLSCIVLVGFYFKSLIKLKNDLTYGMYLYAWPISQSVKMGGRQFSFSFNLSFFIPYYFIVVELDIYRKSLLKYKK